jgi:AcrR family transcriptional regulator
MGIVKRRMNTKRRHDTWHRGLSRGSIAAEALRLLDEEGREALTMRRLAGALGVEAPSLYAHVASKDELVDLILDSVLDGVTAPDLRPDAREALIEGYEAYRRSLLAHPSVVVLMTERARTTGAQLRLAGRAIELLESAGLSTRQAVDTQVTLVAFALGFVLQEVSRPTSMATGTVIDPVLQRAFPTLAERDVDDRYRVGLELILDGAGVPVAASR